MGSLRKLIRDHRRFAALLVALALAMKALVPAGYMIGPQAKMLTVLVCADTQGSQLTKHIAIPQGGKPGEDQGEHGKADATCPYSALSMASLSGADVALLALVLAFILALGFAPVRPARLRRVFHLRPPLRGPPALA